MSHVTNPNIHLDRLSTLVKRLDALGINVPAELLAESRLNDQLKFNPNPQAETRRRAIYELERAPAEEFAAELEKVNKLWNETARIDSGELDETVSLMRYRRIGSQLGAAADMLFGELASTMNRLVSEYRLNELELPGSLTNHFNPMTTTPTEMNAILAFRDAAPVLNEYWDLYLRLANETGHDLSLKEVSSSLDVTFVLGDVTNFEDAKDIAQNLRAARMGVDSAANVIPVAPWGLLNLRGVRIDVKSLNEARDLRNVVQGLSPKESVFDFVVDGYGF